MEISEKMEVVTKEVLLHPTPAHHHALDPDLLGCCPCCPCCNCCSLPDCSSCPSCGSCSNCCCCCPSCCCPPSCSCCCRLCCCLPSLLCKLPKFPSCPVHIKRLLIVVVIVVLIVVIIVGALLMGLFIMQTHTETVLQMTIEGLEGRESQLNFSMDQEEVATFHVDDGINDPATVIYYFGKLLIGYKSWNRKACFLTTMDKGNIQGLDTILKKFQTTLSITSPMQREEEEKFLRSRADYSILGATINILCSQVPIFWV
ncbi:surfactant protein C-like [Paroedura picta]|uniref:surfactant protein C-like n=1 Tax=Paroedura picta TaxID=143630 RepID=UPI004055EE50